jgi:hypothetical protein
MKPCATREALHAWVKLFVGIDIPTVPICSNHDAPFEYLVRAYFEPASDQIVWAPRGGGKTRLAAVATLLDLLHKPGISVRVLGGSLEQSLRLWEHLLPDLRRLTPDLIVEKAPMPHKLSLRNGSSAAVLTQSHRAVRGLRVQKLRCDEVELFKPDIWEASQLITRSCPARLPLPTLDGQRATHVRGSIDSMSTLHAPGGLMSRLVDQAQSSRVPVTRWCTIDVLERCPPTRDCHTCPLFPECQGRAKHAQGFVSIDDAIAMKRRVSRETWESEMLCLRPSMHGRVFPTFDPNVHVSSLCTITDARLYLAIDFGFAGAFVCLFIRSDGTRHHVVDELIVTQQTLDQNIAAIRSRLTDAPSRVFCDPAGNARNEQTSQSNVQRLRAAGWTVRSRRSPILEGIELIRASLRSATGESRLFIDPTCTGLIRALQSLRYQTPASELPFKDGVHDHPVDALRYFFVNIRDRPLLHRDY